MTDSFDIDNFAEIGLAAGDKPLISPTEVADAQDTGDEAVAADNAAREITLDDGVGINSLRPPTGHPAAVAHRRPTRSGSVPP